MTTITLDSVLRGVGAAVAALTVGGTALLSLPEYVHSLTTESMTLPPETSTLILPALAGLKVTAAPGLKSATITTTAVTTLATAQVSVAPQSPQGTTQVQLSCPSRWWYTSCAATMQVQVPEGTNVVIQGEPELEANPYLAGHREHKRLGHNGDVGMTLKGRFGSIVARDTHNALVAGQAQSASVTLRHVHDFAFVAVSPQGTLTADGVNWLYATVPNLAQMHLRQPKAEDPQRTFVRGPGGPVALAFTNVGFGHTSLTDPKDVYKCDFDGDGRRSNCHNVSGYLPPEHEWDGLPRWLPRVPGPGGPAVIPAIEVRPGLTLPPSRATTPGGAVSAPPVPLTHMSTPAAPDRSQDFRGAAPPG